MIMPLSTAARKFAGLPLRDGSFVRSMDVILMRTGGNFMECIHCQHKKTIVLSSRPLGDERYRKRLCKGCNYTFETYEKAVRESVRPYKPHRRKGRKAERG